MLYNTLCCCEQSANRLRAYALSLFVAGRGQGGVGEGSGRGQGGVGEGLEGSGRGRGGVEVKEAAVRGQGGVEQVNVDDLA